MYHIFINRNNEERSIGRADNQTKLLELIKDSEIKVLFGHDAYRAVGDIFEYVKKNNKSEESYLLDVRGIQVNAISNGYEITTLVFYL